MNKGIYTYGILLMGVAAIILISVFSSTTVNSEFDYYAVKEITMAAMEDGIDHSWSSTRDMSSLIRMDKTRFMESFLKRMADATAGNSRDYNLVVYEINEIPPTVVLKVDSITNSGMVKEGENGDELNPTISTIVSATAMSNTIGDRNDEFKLALDDNKMGF